MRFLIDEDMPHSTANLLQQYGHEAVDIRAIGLRGAKDCQIAAYAKTQGLCLLTGNSNFADIRKYPPRDYAGILVLSIPRDASATRIVTSVEVFLQLHDIVALLSGKLVVFEAPIQVQIWLT